MEASGEVLRAVSLLRKVKQPAGLGRLVVTINPRSIQKLNGDFLDEVLTSAKSGMFCAIVGKRSEGSNSPLNTSPVELPERIHVTHIKCLLHGRRS